MMELIKFWKKNLGLTTVSDTHPKYDDLINDYKQETKNNLKLTIV